LHSQINFEKLCAGRTKTNTAVLVNVQANAERNKETKKTAKNAIAASLLSKYWHIVTYVVVIAAKPLPRSSAYPNEPNIGQPERM
jgi:hypothetical protein